MNRVLMGLVGVLWASLVHAYPQVERKPATQSQPPLDLSLQTAVGYGISDDNRSLYVTYGDTFKIIDLATFGLASAQPFTLSSDTTVSGALKGIGLVSSLKTIYATQEGGYLLLFDLNSITTKPTRVQVMAGKNLTLMAVDPDNNALYLYNATDTQLIRYPISTGQATVIDFKAALAGSFTVNNLLFVRNVNAGSGTLYASTNVGHVLAVPAKASAASAINVASNSTHDLRGMAALPNSSAIYVVDNSDKTVRKVTTASNAVTVSISLAQNSDLNQIVVSDVTNPTATYGFVMGSKGLSIFNTADNDVFDLGTTSMDDEPLSVSGTGPTIASSDGYLYLSFGKIAVVSDNPWVTITGVAYSSGSTLGVGKSVTLTWQSDETGTYLLRAGGTVAGTGTLLKDSAGNTAGTIGAVNTDQTVTIPYDSNVSALSEGANTIFLFATDSAGNVGRRATTITVDTPPPAPTIQSVSFGTKKIYVNLRRLDATDIATYRVYVDTDVSAVATKTNVAGTTGQPAAGNEPTVTIDGLVNGVVYYIAADTTDTNGNVSSSRTSTFPSGARASASPEATFGPAGAAGETGCAIVHRPTPYRNDMMPLLLLLLLPLFCVWRYRRSFLGGMAVLLIVASPTDAMEAPHSGPPQWTYELKGGFWIPTGATTQQFFGTCCNLTGMMEGGYLIHGRYGFEIGAGAFYATGNTRGVTSGTTAQDRFSLLLLPVTTDFTFRGHFRPNQLAVPFARGGFDGVFFRENDNGNVIRGIKWGVHGGGGVQFSLRRMTGLEPDFEYNVHDVYLVTEGRYNWINTFGTRGLDLSGALLTLGILMEF